MTNETKPGGAEGRLERLVGRAAADVLDERARQQEREGWTPEHDDEHDDGSMANAAACYAADEMIYTDDGDWLWPWREDDYKPKDRRRDLVRAAALLLAEIERVDRRASNDGGQRRDD